MKTSILKFILFTIIFLILLMGLSVVNCGFILFVDGIHSNDWSLIAASLGIEIIGIIIIIDMIKKWIQIEKFNSTEI